MLSSFPHQLQTYVLALAQAAIAAANGIAIPIRTLLKGTVVQFVVACGDIPADAANLVLKIQYQDKADDSWNDVLDKDGSSLQFGAIFTDGGPAENDAVKGTLPLSYLPDETKAVRVVVTGTPGTSPGPLTVAAAILELYDHNTEQTDYLVEKIRAK